MLYVITTYAGNIDHFARLSKKKPTNQRPKI